MLLAAYTVVCANAQFSGPSFEVLFNYPVVIDGEESFSEGGDAISQKVVSLVDNAEVSIDLAAYNFDHAPLASALRRAKSRGVRVRVVTDIDTSHPSLLSPTPNYFWTSVNEDGLMHHKFLVVDASIAEKATVVTGSTNFTDANIYRFYNDVIIIKDQQAAVLYEQEFELLWGSNLDAPNGARSRSGAEKPRRNITSISIDGLDVDFYFSPNDEVSSRIASEVEGAQSSIAMQLLVLTYDEISDALRLADQRGVRAFGIVENFDSPSSKYNYLKAQGVELEAHFPDEVVHHKYGVIDVENGDDAVIITGSHNWTYSAETFHDENTLVITGSAALAQLYYEAARVRHCDLQGGYNCPPEVSSVYSPTKIDVILGPNPSKGQVILSGFQLNEVEISAYKLVNQLGQPIAAGMLSKGLSSYTLDFSHLPPQTYHLQLFGKGGWYSVGQILLTQ